MIIQEYLNGGVVQTRHPLLLAPGEVQAAANCILKPGDPALHKIAGRNPWGTVRAESVAGCTGVTTTITTSNTFCTAHTPSANLVEGGGLITITGGGFSGKVAGQSVYIDSGTAKTYILRVIDTNNIEVDKPHNSTIGGTQPEVRISDFHPDAFVTANGGQYAEGTKVVTVDSTTTMIVDTNAIAGTSFTAAFSDPITGLAALTFDANQNDVMLAKAASTVWAAPLTSATGGTFASFKTGLTHDPETYLQSISSRKKHVVLTGKDNPFAVYYKDDEAGTVGLTSRAVGMLAVSDGAFIGPSIITGGTWADADNAGGPGFYNFLITEVLKKDGDEIEGTYDGDPKQVSLLDPASEGIKVTYMEAGSTPANDGLYGRNLATHWRVYMAPVEPLSLTEPPYSVYTHITDVPIGENSVDLNNDSIFREGYCRVVSASPVNGNEETFFTEGETGFISGTAGFLAAENAVQVINTSVITTINNAFANCVKGMPVFSPSDNFPSGTIVMFVSNDNHIIVNKTAVTTKSDEALTFGNAPSVGDGVTTICYPNSTSAKYKAMNCTDFDFGTTIGGFAGATITGIKVELFARNQRPHSGTFAIHVWKGGTAAGSSGAVKYRSLDSRSPTKMVAGGQSDTWDLSWESTDFTDATNKFTVRVVKQEWGGTDLEPKEIFDGIKVTVYAGYNTIHGQGNAFQTITVKNAVGESTVLPARFPPPVCSTGDIFNGIMVLNDVDEENVISGSIPDDHDAFPPLYRIPIESKDNDKVTIIRRLGNILVIGMENSIKRMNYFPLESDPDFTRGRAYEDLATDHGIAGPRAATLLDLPGRGVVLAYVSAKGLFWTDGITTTPLNIDIDWDALFQFSLIQRTVLTVYPRQHLLVMQYAPSGATEKTKALYFSYSPSHIKEKMYLPATGPIDMKAESSTPHLVTGKSYLYSGHIYNGIVYEEDVGITTEDNVGPVPTITTRQFLTGRSMDKEGRLKHIHLLLDPNGSAGTQSAFTGIVNVQNEGEASAAQDTFSGSGAVGGITQIWSEIFGDTFNVSLTQLNTAVAFTINYFGFDLQGYGESSN